MAAKKKKKNRDGDSAMATNRKARHNYQVLEKFEAGIVLVGTEVKSVRDRKLSIDESFARVERGELFLYNMHIMPYEQGNQFNHEPRRTRKLLMHKREITRLHSQTQLKGYAIVPLKVYAHKGLIKIQIALCKGKEQQDKREAIKRRTADLESRRAMARYVR
jgi:SsrA-binding protein